MKNFLLVLFFIIQTLNAQWVKSGLESGHIASIISHNKNIYAGTYGGVFLSTNNGLNWNVLQWEPASYTDVATLVSKDTNLFAGAIWRYPGGGSGAIFRSTNNGASWSRIIDDGLTSYPISALSVSGNNIVAMGSWGGIYQAICLSTNNGTNWTLTHESYDVYCLAANDSNLFVGTKKTGVERSTDNGISWTFVNSGLPKLEYDSIQYKGVTSLVIIDTNFFASIYGGGVFRSTNNGTNWTPINAPFSEFSEMIQVGMNIFAGTHHTDINRNRIGSGIFLSTDDGTSWNSVNAGLTDTTVNTISVLGSNLFAGTNSGVWRRPLSEMTAVRDEERYLPKTFSLSQNFPNPFNPSTTIRYSLPSSAHVRLTVYNLLGQVVSELVNEEQSAGWKEVRWNATGFSCGIYFYKLHTGSYVQTKKCLMVK